MSDLRELLEARREDAVQRAEEHARGRQSTHRIVPPAEEAALLDLALASERLAAYDGSSAGAYLGLVEDMRATLDRLAAHLRGGAA